MSTSTISTALSKQPLLHLLYDDLHVPASRLYEYRLVRLLGKGASSKVWLAHHIEKPTVSVAIKEIDLDAKTEETDLTHFKKEVKILNNVKNIPNIVSIKDWFYCSVSKRAYLVTEFVRNVYQRNPFRLYQKLSVDEIPLYLSKLVGAISECHRQGIMHCDIKPSNFIIDSVHQRLAVIDFGHAQFYWRDNEYSSSVGTPAYCAPELLCGFTKYTYAIDTWSIGCVFLLMLLPQASILFQSTSKENQFLIWCRYFGVAAMRQFVETELKLTWYPITCIDAEKTDTSLRSFQSLILYYYCQSHHLSEDAFTREHRNQLSIEHRLWHHSFKQRYHKYVKSAALDLLNQFLSLSITSRPLLKDALQHPYFLVKNRKEIS